MSWEDLWESQGPKLGKQIWACNCLTDNVESFSEIVPNKEGICTHCGYYAKRIILEAHKRNLKNRKNT